jgi:hypothetical protein
VDKLPLASLGFSADHTVVERDGRQYEQLKLRYYVEHAGKTHLFVRIDLEDTEPSVPDERHRFWFHFQPVEQHLPPPRLDDGSIDPSAKPADPLIRDYPGIDLVVFSSVRVRVFRFPDNMKAYQAIGFKEMSDAEVAERAVFSPTRPKITLRRLHRLIQMPLQGTPLHEQFVQPDFSFYSDSHFQTQLTMQRASDVLAALPGTEDTVVANRTWARVFFDEQFTEFNFMESSYSLRVYDQGYDEIDGNLVRNVVHSDAEEQVVNLQEAREKEYTATLLVSHPKYFRYLLGVSNARATSTYTPGPGERFAEPENRVIFYRSTLTIWKSPLVHLVGTVSRHARFDQRTNAILEMVPSNMRREKVNYQDYLPWLFIHDQSDNPLPLAGGLQESSPDVSYLYEKSGYQRYLEFQMSLFLGLTPVVGEAFGLYELYTALAGDQDAFGNPLTDNEKVLVAIAAILPLVNFKMLRGAAHSAEELGGAIAALFPALRETLERNGASARKLATLP